MFQSTSLLAFLLAAISLGASASPLQRDAPGVTLPFAARIGLTGSVNVVAADQARARILIQNASQRSGGNPQGGSQFGAPSQLPVTNTAVTYTTSVGVGEPATQYTLLIDTGSSNTWIGAATKYVPTSSSKSTGETVSVSYGSGSFSGKEFNDKLTLSPELVINSQSIGVASQSTGFGDGIDGILGIGPAGLTQGTTSGGESVPTITDNLSKQGTIPSNAIGVFYAPATSNSETNGELTFGGADLTKITGRLNYAPITQTSPASQYWGVDQTVTYGKTSILKSTAGIVDTGTTLVLFATNAFNAYKKATGGALDSTTGLLKISPAQFAKLKPLNFNIGGETYTLTPNAQIWPRALNTAIGGDASSIYLVVADLGQIGGQGLDFINGYTFLERFYTVYDTTNQRVGFAPTAFTGATTN